jgi:hypothetical protein
VGGTPYTDRLEDDRAFGQEELRKVGVPIIPQENFTAFRDAIAYVKANPNRYVIKPSGEAQNYKRLLFVGEEEDGRDVVQVLEDYERAWADRIKEFQLQHLHVLGGAEQDLQRDPEEDGAEAARGELSFAASAPPCGRPSGRPTTASRT